MGISYRCGLKLKSAAADAGTLKLLRKWFPDRPLRELKQKIQDHEYVYLTDMEKYHTEGKRRLSKLLRELDQAHIETELYEEIWSGGGWRAQPMSREYFGNSLRRSREIERRTLIDIEEETEGFAGPEAMKNIEEETVERWDGEISDF